MWVVSSGLAFDGVDRRVHVAGSVPGSIAIEDSPV